MSLNLGTLPPDYIEWFGSLKQRIQGARQRALLAVNNEQIRLYHDIGREILERQSQQGWGAKVIERISTDLRAAFPDMKGLSVSNLKYMRFFAQECPPDFRTRPPIFGGLVPIFNTYVLGPFCSA